LTDSFAVVVVTYNSGGQIDPLLTTLRAALASGDEVVFVDNASNDDTTARLRGLDPAVTLLEQAINRGFAGGCRVGAQATSAPLLFFLNPDTRVEPDALARLRAVAGEHPEWSAWQPAVMLPDGRINSGGGVAHFLGFGWAGQCEEHESALREQPYEVAFASGAALVIRREAWEKVDGFDDAYFLYGEDLDLGLRLWLSGLRVGVEPRARVAHDYEFDKGLRKWYLLERNRWRTLLADYPLGLLAALAPALLATELALLVLAARGRWLSVKLRADLATVAGLPRLLHRRWTVQAGRAIGTRAFAGQLTASLESPYIPGLPRWVRWTQSAYFSLVRAVLRASHGAPC